MIAERSAILGESSSAASSNDSQAHHQYRLHHAIDTRLWRLYKYTSLRANMTTVKFQISHVRALLYTTAQAIITAVYSYV